MVIIRECLRIIECRNSRNRKWNKLEIRIYLVYNRVGRCILLINQ